MYDELVKRLKNCATQAAPCLTCDMTDDGSCIETMMKQAADAIEELRRSEAVALANCADEHNRRLKLEQRYRWISVTERLPSDDGCYMVAVKNDHRRRYSKTAWFWSDSCSWFARQEVTHWMPLPEPPEDGLARKTFSFLRGW